MNQEEELKEQILALVTKRPGIDSEEIAQTLRIDDATASDLTTEMIRELILREEE